MNTFTTSSSSLSSWPSLSSSISLNSFNSIGSQPQQVYQFNQDTFNQQQRRPITGLRKFSSKQPIQELNLFQRTQFIDTPNAMFSRKVFIGGLPQDIDQDEIVSYFRVYGQLVVDWPHKSETNTVVPPKGYAFLIFEKEKSVQDLINCCHLDKDKLYLNITSHSIKDKLVQIRPWCLRDTDYFMDSNQAVEPRRTVFVGGVPRPLKAVELAMIMESLYGGVCYAGIDTDPELKYPKGAARVSFSNQQSYISAISTRFVQLQQGDIDKKAEVKPYVLDDQKCDLCSKMRGCGKNGPYLCSHISCLIYYCEECWAFVHSKPGKEFHKPLVKEGADRPRIIPFKWC